MWSTYYAALLRERHIGNTFKVGDVVVKGWCEYHGRMNHFGVVVAREGTFVTVRMACCKGEERKFSARFLRYPVGLRWPFGVKTLLKASKTPDVTKRNALLRKFQALYAKEAS